MRRFLNEITGTDIISDLSVSDLKVQIEKETSHRKQIVDFVTKVSNTVILYRGVAFTKD